MTATAEHRPATKRRKFKYDDLDACDLLSGFGGLTGGIERAGFTTITAANHNRYKVAVHEANFPHAEHWIADLVNQDSPTYHDVRDLPAATLLAAGVSCTNHTRANSQKAYDQGLVLFDLDDPEYEARVTRSERDRATANCVLAYARVHHPLLILTECTTELAAWGPALPGRRNVGDGSTYRWWLKQFAIEGYHGKILYLNSMFFGVGQSRNRWYGVFWDKRLPAPDLEHRPPSWCGKCERIVEAVWTWRTGVPASGSVNYGKQYNYRCPACRTEVFPPTTPSLDALDLTNLGTRIGDKPVKKHRDGSTGPMAAATMARAERCRQQAAAEFPFVVMPAAGAPQDHPWLTPAPAAGQVAGTGTLMGAAGHTFERPGSTCRSRSFRQPLRAQTATNATGMLTPPIAMAFDNYQGTARGADEPLPTQGGSETLAVMSAAVLPLRTNATGRSLAEPMQTAVAGAGSAGLGLLSSPSVMTAGGRIKHNGGIGEALYRSGPLSDPFGTFVGSATTQGVLFSGWFKQNGKVGNETAPHPLTDPLGTLTGRDTTAILSAEVDAMYAEYRDSIAQIPLYDWIYRMLGPHEVGWGCGFDVSFPSYGYEGTFIVWGSASEQVDGYGNAVSPQVGHWIGSRLRPILDTH